MMSILKTDYISKIPMVALTLAIGIIVAFHASGANAQANDQVSWTMNPEGIRNAVNAKGYSIPSNSAFHFDNTTASRVCQILGYNRVVSMDTKYPEKYARSGFRDGWYSPHDNQLSRWTGSNFETARANSMGNIWISSLTCADRIGTPTPTPTPVPTAKQCANGIDDDGDGKIDAADSSCHTDFNPNNVSSYDASINDEGRGGNGTCNDSRDNNGNGLIDGADPICHTDGNAGNPASFNGNRNETAPAAAQCANGIDDDGDGKADAADSSCHTDFNPNNAASYDPAITNEGRGGSGTCNDSKDNNGNGLIDGADPLCHTDGNAGNPASFDGNRNETGTTNNVTTVTDQKITVVVANDNKNDDDNTIEFSMSDDRETVKQGEVLTYKLRVRNNRDSDIANVKIVDRLPSYLIPLATQPAASANANARTISWNNQTISANSEVTFALRVRVGNDAPNGYLLQNSAIVNGDGIRANATDATLVQGVVPQVAGASIAPITAVPVSAKTGLPFDTFSILLSLSGSAATAGTLLVKRFI